MYRLKLYGPSKKLIIKRPSTKLKFNLKMIRKKTGFYPQKIWFINEILIKLFN